MEREQIQQVVQAAWSRRQPYLRERCLDAWRLLNGAGDDAPPGLTLDRYDRWWVVATRPTVPARAVQDCMDGAQAVLPAEGIVRKMVCKPVSESRSEVWSGSVPDAPIPIREEDVVLLCELHAGFQTGVFLDHRETRLWARTYAPGAEVLNLFAYTCAFSVHMAKAGARRVTSVDVSRRSLTRGRENMQASGLDPDEHRWFSDDVFKHLKKGQAAAYDVVIVDPPMFGRAKGRTFSLKRQLPELLSGALARVRSGGVLIFSTHGRDVSESLILQTIEALKPRPFRKISIEARTGLPKWDHPVGSQARDDDRGNYLKTLVLRVE